jgi:hypothetical protein
MRMPRRRSESTDTNTGLPLANHQQARCKTPRGAQGPTTTSALEIGERGTRPEGDKTIQNKQPVVLKSMA